MTHKKIFALGFFDGVHLGHQALLNACRKLALEQGLQTAAVTFSQYPGHPKSGSTPPLLTTSEDRVALMTRYGIEAVYTYPFTEEVRTKPWDVFFRELLELGAGGFVCGYDYRFGFQGIGTARKLQEICQESGLPCVVVPEQLLDGVRISSTHIRSLIESGEMEQACRFLGHPHTLSGTVVSGKQLGRTIGVPTANLLIPDGVICPRFGVYACKAFAEGKEYLAVTKVGIRPTVNGQNITVESWLQAFAGDLYGKAITLEFYRFLRPEKKFDTLSALQAEIQKNALQVRKIFEKS